ncbi:HAD family hydrolase [Halobacteriales archaeon QS_3_64_16]|nr:MAG: HAD family hydrolase [Halobacteriales archaeon QS_3_64_16]
MTYRGVVLDLDGTVYRGNEPVSGAREAIAALRERDISLLCFSNNPTLTPEAYADRLADLGIEVNPSEIASAASVTATYLAREHPDDRIFLVGSSGLRDQLEDAGLALTEKWAKTEVLVASYDRGFDYDRLTEALWALEGKTTFVGTDPDMTIPHSDGHLVPGSGAIIHAVAGVAGQEPDIVLGKPSSEARDAAIGALELDPQQCLVVGDRLDTDIALGAGCGMDTAVVLSGVTSEADLPEADPSPDHVLDSIADLESVL